MLLLTPVMMHPWMKFMLFYVDDEHVDNHDYDDTTDDDHDNNNDIYVSGPDPDQTQARLIRTRPDRARPVRNTLYSVKI